MLRVLAIGEVGGVSEFYRVVTPYQLLAEAGYIELRQDDGFTLSLIDHLDEFDVVVFSRADSEVHTLLLLKAQEAGLRVVFDIDDNLLLVPPSIGVFGAWHQRGTGKIQARAWLLKHNIKRADVLTVSTQALGCQLCNGQPHQLRPAGDFHVLPNMVMAEHWRDVQPLADKPAGEMWVGWWGIYNHWDDWRDIAPYVEPVIAARPECRLVLLGMPELAMLFPQLAASGQLVTGPFIAPEMLHVYRPMVAAFDVALAPTDHSAFNESKSDLKVVQYLAAGVPVIASETTYGQWGRGEPDPHVHQLSPYVGDAVTVIDRPEFWGKALEWLLNNPEPARQGAAELRQVVLRDRAYEYQYERWLEVLYD